MPMVRVSNGGTSIIQGFSSIAIEIATSHRDDCRGYLRYYPDDGTKHTLTSKYAIVAPTYGGTVRAYYTDNTYVDLPADGTTTLTKELKYVECAISRATGTGTSTVTVSVLSLA